MTLDLILNFLVKDSTQKHLSPQCTEDSTVEDPWVGRAVALYQLFTLLVIPLLLSVGCYQAVIR